MNTVNNNEEIRLQEIYKSIHKPKQENINYKDKTKYEYELGIDYFKKTNK